MAVFKQYMRYLAGTILISLGVALMIKFYHLGVGSWDVLQIGLLNHFGLTVGTWNLIIGALLTVWVWVKGRKYVSVGTVLNVLLVSPLIDLFLWLLAFDSTPHLSIDILLFGAGAALCGFGGAVYVHAGLGAGPRDAVVLMLRDQTGGDLFRIRLIMEILVCGIGFALGGPLFYGTIASAIIISYVFKVAHVWMEPKEHHQ